MLKCFVHNVHVQITMTFSMAFNVHVQVTIKLFIRMLFSMKFYNAFINNKVKFFRNILQNRFTTFSLQEKIYFIT